MKTPPGFDSPRRLAVAVACFFAAIGMWHFATTLETIPAPLRHLPRPSDYYTDTGNRILDDARAHSLCRQNAGDSLDSLEACFGLDTLPPS